MTTSNRRK